MKDTTAQAFSSSPSILCLLWWPYAYVIIIYALTVSIQVLLMFLSNASPIVLRKLPNRAFIQQVVTHVAALSEAIKLAEKILGIHFWTTVSPSSSSTMVNSTNT